MALVLGQVAMVIVVLQSPGKDNGIPAVKEREIRELLDAEEFKQDVRDNLAKLGGYGPAAFPLYARILDGPKEDPLTVSRTLRVLSELNADRSQFVDRAVTKLAHTHPSVRHTAVELLAHIGSARDAAPVVALLSDREWEISLSAAKTLSVIGDPRTLAAMDVWLNSSNPLKDRNERFNELHRKDIAKYRDELKKRLEKPKKAGS